MNIFEPNNPTMAFIAALQNQTIFNNAVTSTMQDQDDQLMQTTPNMEPTAMTEENLIQTQMSNCTMACMFCPIGFTDVNVARRHMYLAHGRDPEALIKQFKDTLDSTKQYVYDDNNPIVPVNYDVEEDEEGLYPCPICVYKKCVSRHNVMLHINQHFNRKFKCQRCPSAFKSEYALKEHDIVHTDERIHNCNQCDRAYKRRSSLNDHVKAHHIKDIMYRCHICEYRSFCKGYVQRHLREVHLKRREFYCTLCPYVGKGTSAVKAHMEYKHNQPYACTRCNFVARTKEAVLEHATKEHIYMEPTDCVAEKQPRRESVDSGLDSLNSSGLSTSTDVENKSAVEAAVKSILFTDEQPSSSPRSPLKDRNVILSNTLNY